MTLRVPILFAIAFACLACRPQTSPGETEGAADAREAGPPAVSPSLPTPLAAPGAEKIILQAEQPFLATVTMDPREGSNDAFAANYRPTLLFDAAPTEVVCILDMSQPISEFKPGDSGRVSVRCRDDVTVTPDRLGFIVREGRGDVGRGTVELPAQPGGQ